MTKTFYAWLVLERMPDGNDRLMYEGAWTEAYFAYNNLNCHGYTVRIELHQYLYEEGK
jgi:uncharacterized protein YozE (UPF0346 family)